MAKAKQEKKRIISSRGPKFLDEKYTGGEPIWDSELASNLSDDKFDDLLRRSLNYYNYFFSVKDLKPDLIKWVKEYCEENPVLDKDTISKFAKASDNVVPLTACSLVRAFSKGMPIKERHISYIFDVVNRAVSAKVEEIDEQEVVVVKKETPKPTIQDRISEIAKEHVFYFIDYEDEMLDGKVVDPKAFSYLTNKNVPQAMLSRIMEPFQKHHNEFMEAKAGTCDQLKEGYKKLKAADYKRIDSFYTKLFEGFYEYANVKKATKKAQVRKPPAKEKIVSKLKYLKTDSGLKLVSINPVDIIGAKELWVYNVKTRKIGKYIADSHQGNSLNIKGSAIVGYDESASVAKTLRKPEQQMKEFMNAGKIQIRKYLENIKATEIKLNGRINSDTVLLKVST